MPKGVYARNISGANNPNWKGGVALKSKYVRRHVPDHPRADSWGYVDEHVLIVEKAMGKYLSRDAEIHHANGDERDNTPSNLVVCQDHAYHMLLHARMRQRRKSMTSETATLTEQPHELEQQVGDLKTQAFALKVVDQASLEQAAGMRRSAIQFLAKIAEVFDPIDAAQIAARKVTIAQRKRLEEPAKLIKDTMGERMAGYELGQELLRRAAEVAARMEQERLEADARAVAEAETKRLQALADEAALAVAIQAEEQGDVETAEHILEQPVFVPPVMPTPVFAPPVSVAKPQVAGVSFRDVWEFVVTDAVAIPRQYLTPDLVKIGGVVRAMKGQTNIPGIRVVNRRTTAQRA